MAGPICTSPKLADHRSTRTLASNQNLCSVRSIRKPSKTSHNSHAWPMSDMGKGSGLAISIKTASQIYSYRTLETPVSIETKVTGASKPSRSRKTTRTPSGTVRSTPPTLTAIHYRIYSWLPTSMAPKPSHANATTASLPASPATRKCSPRVRTAFFTTKVTATGNPLLKHSLNRSGQATR